MVASRPLAACAGRKADVPRGGILDGGTMKLKIEDDGTGNVRMVKVSEQTGDFGNKTWTPCQSG